MRMKGDQLQLSASDLAKHLVCRHLTSLDLLHAAGKLKRPFWQDPGVAVLEQRGFRHEAAYLAHLEERGLQITRSEAQPAARGLASRPGREMQLSLTFDSDEMDSSEWVIRAMKCGAPVIVQAELADGRWRGRADVLLRVPRPSNLGDWSYEVVDTKLALETKGGTILQLCLYSDLVAQIQGVMPEFVHVVTPARNFQPETFRLHNYLAYYRFVRARLEKTVATETTTPPYPDPVEYCFLCNWWPRCDDRRRNDDHLSFVAGISKLQIGELHKWGVDTLAQLANMPMPLETKPDRGSPDTYERVREQARLQLEYRSQGKPVHELLALDPPCGLYRLPEPSPGDLFLDFEADPFVEDGGLEYLLGFAALNQNTAQYQASWALNRADERRMFEGFIDDVMRRWSRFPDLHIYHFSQYEPTALKRLMGRYASREDEMDRLLRAGVFVDLHSVVRQALRASVERYSLKDLEVFFGFQRSTALQDARKHLRILECGLELNDVSSVPVESRQIVEAYNREDCLSTLYLRNWLEGLRSELVQAGHDIPRPPLETGAPSEAVDERRKRVLALMERLLQDVSDDPSLRSSDQQAVWLVAHMLEWHRREAKSEWWEFFRLQALSDEERMEERFAISGLRFVKRLGGTDRCPVDRYEFPAQEMEIREGDSLETNDGKFGSVVSIGAFTIDVKKTGDAKETHPSSVFVHNQIDAKEQPKALSRLAEWIADYGIDANGPHRAARDLLLRKHPRLSSKAEGLVERSSNSHANIVEVARKVVLELDHGVLPIQGPPGAGKTYLGARMICELVRCGKKVGITAVSHKVIQKMLHEVVSAAAEDHLDVSCIEKVREISESPHPSITETEENAEVVSALQSGDAQIGAGTAWLWSREDLSGSVDVLFVDEAGQMSLADVLSVSQAASSVVLLGDPQQLEQPLQGTHPPGIAVSALQHILGEHPTMPAHLGIFLPETWRLSPAICAFTSELFYEGRLHPRDGLERQALIGNTRFAGTGLWYVSVVHEGNQNCSDEEAAIVKRLVDDFLNGKNSWRDRQGNERLMTWNDILIVAPYNAQVFKLQRLLPKARIGTVDKFQGQEAPVVIYTMATSTPEEAPHGLEFLYSLNRFNVATSRARCACILAANPRLFEPECKTPFQIRLANVLCRYRELARTVSL